MSVAVEHRGGVCPWCNKSISYGQRYIGGTFYSEEQREELHRENEEKKTKYNNAIKSCRYCLNPLAWVDGDFPCKPDEVQMIRDLAKCKICGGKVNLGVVSMLLQCGAKVDFNSLVCHTCESALAEKPSKIEPSAYLILLAAVGFVIAICCFYSWLFSKIGG
jgi:hypothetical protein